MHRLLQTPDILEYYICAQRTDAKEMEAAMILLRRMGTQIDGAI